MRISATWFSSRPRSRFFNFCRSIPALFLAVLIAPRVAATPLYGQQNTSTQIHGSVDQGVVLPKKIALRARQDPGALQEIRAFRSVVGAGLWVGMQGTGELTSTAVGSSDPENATLWIRNHHGYRLDVQKPKGMSSVRMDGAYGAVQHPDGKVKPMDARDAVDGLLAFPLLMEANFPAANVMLVDRGMVTVGGNTLHRISMERPWPGNPVDARGNPYTTITDLYFNPQTHLLVKSANGVLGSDPSPQKLLQVITYGNYQTVNGMQIPYLYRETLNGQKLWTLQLQQVQLNQNLPQSDFHF